MEYNTYENLLSSFHEQEKKDKPSKKSSDGIGYVVTFAALLCIGLINIYSGTFSYCLENNTPQFTYLVNQLIFIAFGFLLFLFFYKASIGILKVFSLAMIFFSLVFIFFNVFSSDLINDYFTQQILFFSYILYMGFYFGSREKKLPLKSLVFPCLMTALIIAAVFYKFSFSQCVVFLLFTFVMMYICKVSFKAIFLYSAFSFIPCCVCVLASPEKLRSFFEFFIPGIYGESKFSRMLIFSKSALSGGGFTGCGIGNGLLKKNLEIGEKICTEYSLCHFCEEMGFLGFILLFALFIVMVWKVFQSYERVGEKNRNISYIALACCFHIFSMFCINVFYVTSYLPMFGSVVPFISYGAQNLIFMAEFGIMYRMVKCKSTVLKSNEENYESGQLSEI